MRSILNPKFRYVPASSTDIRKTFARIIREQKAEAVRRASTEAQNVQNLNLKRKAHA